MESTYRQFCVYSELRAPAKDDVQRQSSIESRSKVFVSLLFEIKKAATRDDSRAFGQPTKDSS